MKLIDALNFCYSNYPIVYLRIEMQGGVEGKYRKTTKKQILALISGLEETEVTDFIINNYHSCLINDIRHYFPMDIPHVYLEYSEPKNPSF